MRKIFLIGLFITLFVILQVKAASDCAVIPANSPDQTWCDDCSAQPKTDKYCTFCQLYSPYATLDGLKCTYLNCSSPTINVNSSYCFECASPDKFYSQSLNKCISYDCSSNYIKPFSKDFCWWCYKNFYPTLDGSACQIYDCSTVPSPLTEMHCSICHYPKTKVNTKGTECVEIDCDTKPASGAYTDDWCQNCSNPKVNALTNKSGCDTGDTFTATTPSFSVTSTNGYILTVLSNIFILIIFV